VPVRTFSAPTLNGEDSLLDGGREAQAIVFGGISMLARATGICRDTLSAGALRDAGSSRVAIAVGIRRRGGGRKKTADSDPTLKEDL